MLTINEVGHEVGLEGMAERGDLPLLQDTSDEMVWTSWAPTYRDVIILDADNVEVDRYNLTLHSLAIEENYETLKALLIDAGGD